MPGCFGPLASRDDLNYSGAMARASSLKSLGKGALAIGLTALALGLLVRQISRSPLASQSFDQLDLSLLSIPLCSTCLAVLLSATKWQQLLAAMGQRLAWRTAMRALLVAWPYAAVTPSRAGDLVRAWVIRAEVPLALGGVSVVIDRVLDVQSLLILSLVGAMAQGWWLAACIIALPWIGIWALAMWLKRRPLLSKEKSQRKLWDALCEAQLALHEISSRPRALALSAGMSLCTWLLVQTSFWYLNEIFSTPLSWLESFGLWPMATLLGLVPLTLAGMGTRDVAFIVLLALSREHIHLALTEMNNIQTLVAASGHRMLATVAYTALSSWMFAIIGLPWAIHEWLSRKNQASVETQKNVQAPR